MNNINFIRCGYYIIFSKILVFKYFVIGILGLNLNILFLNEELVLSFSLILLIFCFFFFVKKSLNIFFFYKIEYIYFIFLFLIKCNKKLLFKTRGMLKVIKFKLIKFEQIFNIGWGNSNSFTFIRIFFIFSLFIFNILKKINLTNHTYLKTTSYLNKYLINLLNILTWDLKRI